MAQPILHEKQTVSSLVASDQPERRLRQTCAWLVLYFLMQAELGLAWDRQWHDLLGRDTFWIPPHILLYTGVAAAGLVTLGLVLLDTRRYYQQKAGVDDSSTIPIFRFFHAPLGFTILGFGALNDLLAAPLDNYWHQLYGIDVTLWSPFHVMGTIGGVLMGLGSIYAFASEAVLEQQDPSSKRFLTLNGPEWGLLLLLAAFMEIALPALTAFPPVALGLAWPLLTYPLPLAAVGGFCLISAVQATRKTGAATLTAILLFLVSLVTQTFVPIALSYAVAHLGLSYRFADRTPTFSIALVLIPFLFVLCALVIDGIAFWRYRRQETTEKHPLVYVLLSGGVLAVATTVVPAALVYLLHLFPFIKLSEDIVRIFTASWQEMLLALPFAFCIAVIVIPIGVLFGDIWHWSKR